MAGWARRWSKAETIVQHHLRERLDNQPDSWPPSSTLLGSTCSADARLAAAQLTATARYAGRRPDDECRPTTKAALTEGGGVWKARSAVVRRRLASRRRLLPRPWLSFSEA